MNELSTLLKELNELRRRVLSLEKSNRRLKRDIEAYMQRGERFRQIFDNAPEGIYQTTPKGRFLGMNQAFARICGYDTPEEMMRLVTNIKKQLYVNPDDREELKKVIAEKGILKNFETRFCRRDGMVIWVSIYAQAFKDDHGKIIFQGTIQDITDRKRVEEELEKHREYLEELVKERTVKLKKETTERRRAEEVMQESEERFSLAFRVSPAPLIIIDAGDGIVLDVNDRFLNMTGYGRDELIGKESGKLPIWADYKVRAAIIRKFFKEGSLRDEAVQLRAKSGEIRHTLWSAEMMKYRGREVVLSLLYDITELRKAEEALRESEERYRIAIEHPNDGVVIVQKDRRLYVSNKFREILGYKPGENEGKPFLFTVHPDDREDFREKIRKKLDGEYVPSSYELRLIKKDGSTIYVDCTVVKVTYKGEPASLGYVRDITERKNLENELKKSRDELRALALRLDKIREEERAKVALEIHDELGQHLTAMKLGLAWLNKKMPKDENGFKERIKTLTGDADIAVKMVRKISTGLRPPVLDSIGLEAALEWQAGDFQKRTGIRCRFRSKCKGLQLHEEKTTALFRIAQESLTNIARHSRATEACVDLFDKNGNVVLKIKDNGVGIKGGALAGSKPLGIIGMRERALSLGGSLEINSRPGEGTTVTLTMPG